MLQYFDGDKLKRHIRTYKSNVLDSWFNYSNIIDILREEVDTCENKDLTIEEYLKYLNLGFNRNKNWCINFIALSIFKPFLNKLNGERNIKCLIECGIVEDINEAVFEDASYTLDFDDDYDSWRCRRHDPLEKARIFEINRIAKKLQSYFLGLKTHNRNPNDSLVVDWVFQK
jgi:hypothetical protein